MKRAIILLACLAILLAGCEQKAAQTWRIETDPSTEHTLLSADELCSAYAAVTANFWQMEAGQWQLTIIEAPKFVVAIYIADQTYEISANNMDELKQALQEYPCKDRLDEILAEDPYIWYANTGAESPDGDGWGTKQVLGYELPWPAIATDFGTGWSMDDVSFQVTNISTQDDAEQDLKDMAQTLTENDVEQATILYYQDSTYQGLAFQLNGVWDISLARFDSNGSIYLSLVGQEDFEYAKELAARYSMKLGMEALEVSEPYYIK